MRSDLISRQAAIAVADSSDYTGLSVEDVKKVTDEVVKGLKRLPSVEPERKRGNWKQHIFDGIMGGRPTAWVCDNCNGLNVYKTDFCPNCGADMREREGK